MNIQLFQALWSLNKLKENELPSFAAELLNAGLDSVSLRVLAGLEKNADTDEILRYFQSTVNELGLTKISPREASFILAKHIAEKIISGTIDPYTGAREIWSEVCTGNDYPKELNAFIVDASDYEEHHPKDPKILVNIVENAKRLSKGEKLI